MNMNENTGISVMHIYKSFGKDTVLRDVSLTVGRGQIAGLVGNNGSGKTVLMKCICGFLRPDRGEITVCGKRIGKDCDFPESVGIIIETPGFIPYYSGYKNLKLLASLSDNISDKDIKTALERVGLDPEDKRTYKKYSLGMKQKLGIANAIMGEPDIIILDEGHF